MTSMISQDFYVQQATAFLLSHMDLYQIRYGRLLHLQYDLHSDVQVQDCALP